MSTSERTPEAIARSRRRFLTGGAAAAGGSLVAAAALASPAGAQEGGTQGLVPYAEPFRTYDSREDADGPIEPGETYTVDLGEVPDGTLAVVINLTVVNTEANGYLVVYGQGRVKPGVSTINWFDDGQILANQVITTTGESDNDLLVHNGGSGSTDFIVDVYGYFT